MKRRGDKKSERGRGTGVLKERHEKGKREYRGRKGRRKRGEEIEEGRS